MAGKEVVIGNAPVGGEKLAIIAGPCAVESEKIVMQAAETVAAVRDKLDLPVIFKSSYMKANRLSGDSFSTIGIEKALSILAKVKDQFGLPILTDVHSSREIELVAETADCLQIPAFLCRQTELVMDAAKTGLPVNIKKGQFLAPWDMKNVVEKARAVGNEQIMVCERGVSFGYNNLVSDMRSLPIMAQTGYPVVFDATHSVMQPGAAGDRSGGDRRFVPVLARAAVAVGVAAVFMETHQDPDNAPSDGPNMVRLEDVPALVETLLEIDRIAKKKPVVL
jgi:2-dehydro-3-deoxyphosphooctonate aldolase (KDO 8-P synthase)